MRAPILKVLRPLVLWFDASAVDREAMTDTTVVDWFRVLPFIAMHAACLSTAIEEVRDLARYPELRCLDRFEVLVPVAIGTTWHNNHRKRLGVIHDLRPPPERLLRKA